MNRILILGGSGLVGKALVKEMNKHQEYEVYATYCTNPIQWYKEKSFKLNIDDTDNINSLLNKLKPQSIIACLRGDYNKQLDVHIKTAEYLQKYGGKMYFCSTTNVFDNDLSKPHYEDDLPESCSDYGQFKIECEKRIIELLNENASILRLPQMLGKDSPRINNLLKSLSEGKEIEVYPKLFINTNTDVMLAKQIHYIIQHNLNGIFHLAAEDIIPYKDLYCRIIKGMGYNSAKIKENLDEKGYFTILSHRNNEFTDDLRVTNSSVIDYLIN